MTGVELIELVAERTGLTKKDVSSVLWCALSAIVETCRTGEKVGVSGFGVFTRRTSKPSTAFGKTVPAITTLKFKPSPKIREFTMEKYGVEFEDGHEKQGSQGNTADKCPACGRELDGPAHCPRCGTKPFEKRQDKKGAR